MHNIAQHMPEGLGYARRHAKHIARSLRSRRISCESCRMSASTSCSLYPLSGVRQQVEFLVCFWTPSTSPPPRNLPFYTTSHEIPFLSNTTPIRSLSLQQSLLPHLPRIRHRPALLYPHPHILKANHIATIGTDHDRAESRRHRMEMVSVRDDDVGRCILYSTAFNGPLSKNGFVMYSVACTEIYCLLLTVVDTSCRCYRY